MDRRDTLINELRALVAKQAAQLEKQAARIAELELQLAKALKDSSTSSKPPSSDIAKKKPKKKPGRPKKPRLGGQPGHEQHLRQPLPEDRVNETADYEINEADVQRLGLSATGEFGREDGDTAHLPGAKTGGAKTGTPHIYRRRNFGKIWRLN
jgi:hypothetical protein